MLNELQRLEIKGVTRLAVVEAGGQENAANVTRIRRAATFSDYAHADRPDVIALDVAIELDQFNGNGRLIGKAADLLGFALFRRPSVALPASDEAGLLACARESTEALAAGWAALADGIRTDAERRHEIQQIDEAIASLLQRRAWLAGDM